MLRHAGQRLLLTVPVLLGVLLVGFLLMQVVPTDPAVVRAGPAATAEVAAQIRADLGLDGPLRWHVAIWVKRLALAISVW
jgi:glutathione transport system permease protein